MTALPAGDAAAAGGMVNMTRGIGTALGVAVVALGLHAGALLGHSGVRTGQETGQEVAMAALAAVALAAAWAGLTASGSRSRPGSQAGAGLT